jgi:hypothetical protein
MRKGGMPVVKGKNILYGLGASPIRIFCHRLLNFNVIVLSSSSSST